MPNPASILERYLQRIGYHGSREPTLATLRSLHLHHGRAIPFENLDVVLERRISIDLDVVAEKLITQHRGGYCFEQNTLFREMLRTLGFKVVALLARVRWQVPAEVATARTHMVLQVDIDERPWMADVGFGGIGTTEPLALDSESEQATSHETRRLVRTGNDMLHQVRIGDEWHDVYLLNLKPPPLVDFELGNWYSCTHPHATFVNNLVAALVTPTGRAVIFNHELTLRSGNGTTTTQPIRTQAELRELLVKHFGLHFPAETNFIVPSAPWPV